MYNINPTLNKKNPPLEIYVNKNEKVIKQDFDFAGFTCIEGDYLYKGYSGNLSIGS